MTTSTYGEIKNGKTRFFSVDFGQIISIRLLFGRVSIELEATGASTMRSVDDEVVSLPVDAIID